MPQQVTPIVPTFSRRTFTRLGLGMAAASVAGPLWAQATPKVIRIGYQKFNTLNILKGAGHLEAALKPLGWSVQWTEFVTGPVLLEALNAWARSYGAQSLWLEVRKSNTRAHQIYETHGYRRVGVRKAYYPAAAGLREDAIVMQLNLCP